jgi:hypothetical protein
VWWVYLLYYLGGVATPIAVVLVCFVIECIRENHAEVLRRREVDGAKKEFRRKRRELEGTLDFILGLKGPPPKAGGGTDYPGP